MWWPPTSSGQDRSGALKRGRARTADYVHATAIAGKEPATLNEVAKVIGRGAPAVSRSVDALVRAGLVERTQDPNNRRRLALRLTQAGRDQLSKGIAAGPGLKMRLERLAHSELRALERAIEILERG